ncbi:hypothetical protein F7725_013121 [Dissostichus mawsoni]|uniref:Secreted protein n=1 Tax=Dissostichus mawsoni TaxID=36200 RepID=A0A7J5YRN3_DISMA|nr:hypothetical protein F7725_013121 [Dissostichus mawsoni]
MKPEQLVSVFVLQILSVTWSAKEGTFWCACAGDVGRQGTPVKVLVPSTSMFMNSSEPSRFSYEPFNVSVSKEPLKSFLRSSFTSLSTRCII